MKRTKNEKTGKTEVELTGAAVEHAGAVPAVIGSKPLNPALAGVLMETSDFDSDELTQWKQTGLPPIIKFAELPIGAVICGQIQDVVPSSDPKIKTGFLYLDIQRKNEEGHLVPIGRRAALPISAVIETAIGGGEKEKVFSPKNPKAKEVGVETLEGCYILIRLNGQAAKRSKGKNAAWMMDVLLKAPAVAGGKSTRTTATANK